MVAFVPGVELARGFYAEVVRPLLDESFGDLPHAAALIGEGSEVVGFDTERSTDREWGPRLLVFLDAGDVDRHGAEVVDLLARRLPATFRGWSTDFGTGGSDSRRETRIDHRVEVHAAGPWFRSKLGFDPADGVGLDDWLATPGQLLLMVTAGEVFHDAIDALGTRRQALAWYPHDVWLYLVGCQWLRVSREESFVGRTGEVGDDLGSRVVAARVARDLMRLCFLLERRYPPYGKWLGRAFEQLDCAGEVAPHLHRALSATVWQRREAALGAAAECVGTLHNRLEVTRPVDTSLRLYHDRPFLVLDAGRFAEATFAAIEDPRVATLPPGVGAVDQWVDSAEVLAWPARARRAWRALREPDDDG